MCQCRVNTRIRTGALQFLDRCPDACPNFEHLLRWAGDVVSINFQKCPANKLSCIEGYSRQTRKEHWRVSMIFVAGSKPNDLYDRMFVILNL